MRVSDCENCGRGAQSNNRSERKRSERSQSGYLRVLSRSSSHLSISISVNMDLRNSLDECMIRRDVDEDDRTVTAEDADRNRFFCLSVGLSVSLSLSLSPLSLSPALRQFAFSQRLTRGGLLRQSRPTRSISPPSLPFLSTPSWRSDFNPGERDSSVKGIKQCFFAPTTFRPPSLCRPPDPVSSVPIIKELD